VVEVGLCLCFPIALSGSKPTKELAFSSWSPKIFVQSTLHLGKSHFLGALLILWNVFCEFATPYLGIVRKATREASRQLPNCTL
jgi:hypothetical protein